MATADVAVPFLRTFNAPTNSDYFPVVDQRASKTRFTQVRVREMIELQDSSIPLLEMLGASPVPSAKRHAASPTTYIDGATAKAWTVHDIVMGQPAAASGLGSEVAALAVAQWASACQTGWRFEQMLPSFVEVAGSVNAHLNPQVAGAFWQRVATSPCAKSLTSAERLWFDLFDAVARRDAAKMAAVAPAILEGIASPQGAMSEMPFFAAVAGLICTGQSDKARGLLEQHIPRFVRSGTRTSEIRLLDAMTTGPQRRCAGAAA